MTRSEWQVWAEQERRRERRDRIIGLLAMVASGVVMAIVLWLAFVGFVAVFG